MKKKLKLKDLEVKSFITGKEHLRGGEFNADPAAAAATAVATGGCKECYSNYASYCVTRCFWDCEVVPVISAVLC